MPISLKPHNIETYQKVNEKLKESNRVAVIHPTGTGKMFIALKFLEENKDKKAIYVAPSNPILHDVKKNIFAEGMTMEDFPQLKRITYQKLMNLTDEEIEKLEADIIILDEFHHCGAPEWGKGVERLIQKNKGAKILGLSATPLRYFDGLRDMADELFENNVASEMSLEEAIENGILPEATYVSTLYGYDKELENMQTDIEKMQNKEEKEQAQNLLNDLKGKLDENTQNLPELFSEYMQNASGKYIIFCRNIEDMNEKKEQAQKMFGKVNHNMTIRAVSSKIKKTDKILTEFEQDTDEGTLKLLYAVDMLNEGYHINDLDGVVMMRPTLSPTIYTQQLGRALTVGGNRKPVVLDLVNNFDSCKIIEDFAERMKQYKGHEGTGREEGIKKSRISIFDKTKEFREIVEKIAELSKRRTISLEEKIQIFEKFSETGEELVGNTIFEGHPIGQWAIQIRSVLNRINNEKKGKQIINPTEEQLERLKRLGILERQIGSTIDEKIDALVTWREKYPKVKIVPDSSEILCQYAKTEDEQQQIIEEYEKMLKYYEYVKARKSRSKLNKEQILKCKEGDVGGVFGYPTKVEDLAKKYNIAEKDIDYILTKYGTLDNFYEMHKKGEIRGKKDIKLEEIILNAAIDIDGNFNRGYDELYRAIKSFNKSNDSNFYSSEELKKIINGYVLNEREKFVLDRVFGLTNEEEYKGLEILGSEIGVTRERVKQIKVKALRKLSIPNSFCRFCYNFSYDTEFITDEERKQIEEIKKDILLQKGDLSKNLGKLKSISEEIEKKKEEKLNNEAEIEKEFTDNTDEQQEEIKPEDLTQEQLLQKILEQQRIIAEQRSEIDKLKNLRTKQHNENSEKNEEK